MLASRTGADYHFGIGDVKDVPPTLAEQFIVEGAAMPVDDVGLTRPKAATKADAPQEEKPAGTRSRIADRKR